jgi:thioredoxin-like negative regulator of GroEL
MEFGVETRQLLTEIGMLACVTNQVAAAERIAAGLAAIAPGSREAVICSALAAMTAGRADEAADRLNGLAEAGDPYGAVFLGFALRLAGRTSEAERVLSNIPAGAAEADALAAALR